MKRSVFFVSDSTGITAETLGHALLSQFETLEYAQATMPFVGDEGQAREAVRRIDAAGITATTDEPLHRVPRAPGRRGPPLA